MDHFEAPVHMNLNEHELQVWRITSWIHLPDDVVKATLVSKVYDEVEIHGMNCECHMQSREGTAGIQRLLRPATATTGGTVLT